MAEEATDLNVEWTFAVTSGRPFVTLEVRRNARRPQRGT